MQMPSASQELENAVSLVPHASHRFSTQVRFQDERAGDVATSVEIYEVGGGWYCRICRGEEKTRPLGPYSRRQAERVQDIRTSLLAKRGAARLDFDEASGIR